MQPIFVLLAVGAVLGGVIGTLISMLRARSYPKDDKRRWGPAIFGSIISYWAVLLGSLGIGAWLRAQTHYPRTFDYEIGGLSIALAVFAGCFLATAFAPRPYWRQMSYASAAAFVIWTIYFSHNDPAFADELVGTLCGAAAAAATAHHRFRHA